MKLLKILNFVIIFFWPKIDKIEACIALENIEHTLAYLSNCTPVSGVATLILKWFMSKHVLDLDVFPKLNECKIQQKCAISSKICSNP